MSLDSSTTVPSFGACAIVIKLAELLFDYCYYCDFNKLIAMPAVPQGAFAACKVREQGLKIAKMQTNEQDQEKMFYNGKYLELSPLKYNSKLMNSIWGLYNRYSVHNFKKNTDAEGFGVAGSQISGYPASADKMSTEIKRSKSSQNLVPDWINIWGTHKSY